MESSLSVANMWISAVVLLGAYILIFTEMLHRTSAAVLGAVTMTGIGMLFGFYSQESAIAAVDGNTLLLLLAMMMLVSMLRPTGGLEYLGIKLAKLAGGDPRRLLIYLCLVTSLFSMVLDNVTTVLIFAPLTVLITRILDINPAPFLIGEAMLSNIGGAATLVGDPPNIMIGSVSGLDFVAFIVHMGPLVVPAWIVTIGLLLFLFRKQLQPIEGLSDSKIDLDETKAIKDHAALWRITAALVLTVALFFVHHRLHLFPSYVAWIGVAVAMLISASEPEKLLEGVEWSVLLFFAALFIIVGGVESSGLLGLIGQELALFAADPAMLLWSALLVMWTAAILSAIVDNIPFTVTMLPIIAGLEASGTHVTPLWWALAIGVGLGGNVTHIGATANIICVAESEHARYPNSTITPIQWLRVGLPVMLNSLGVVSVIFIVFFEWFL